MPPTSTYVALAESVAKPGVKTTEMWQGAGTAAGLLAFATGHLTEIQPTQTVQIVCCICASVVSCVYILARSMTKSAYSPFRPGAEPQPPTNAPADV